MNLSKLATLVSGAAAIALLCIASGCQTAGPVSDADRAALRAEKQKQAEERRLANLKAQEEREAAESVFRSQERQQKEARDLREKFERYTTAELKLMHQRYLELAAGKLGTQSEVNLTVNKLWGTTVGQRSTEKIVELERELLRRWKAGDAEAKLPQFETDASAAAASR